MRVIAVVGEDFGPEQEAVFQARNIDTRGIEHTAGKSFFWEGSYLENLNEAKTHNTELNVFAAFEPKIPEAYRDSEFLFLANIDPVLQRRVREAMPRCETGGRRHHELLDQGSSRRAARSAEGPRYSAHQRHRDEDAGRQQQPCAGGARGAGDGAAARWWSSTASMARRFLWRGREWSRLKTFRAPALPLEEVVDPTGAGDSFAGGFFGYLASQPELTPAAFRRAMFYGSVMGSFACERFGTERLAAAHAQGDRRALQSLPRVDAP